MEVLLLAGRIALAAVFAVAGFSKLSAFAAARRGLVEFGVPEKLAGASATILIVAELSVAIALLTSNSWYGALGAAALLAAFSAAIASNLLRDRRPNCNCFGQLSASPIGWPTFARNFALLGIAVAVAVEERSGKALTLAKWLSGLTQVQAVSLVASVVAVALVAFVVVLLMQILQQQGRILLRFEQLEERLGFAESGSEAARASGMPPGSDAPQFALPDLEGRSVELNRLLENTGKALLLFSNPHCRPCQELLSDAVGWQREFSGTMRVAVISEGEAAANRSKFADAGAEIVLLQAKREVAERYGAFATPAALIVSNDGRIASYIAHGAAEIRSLVEAARNGGLPSLPERIRVPKIGESVPELTLPTIGGDALALHELRGLRTMLLFWNQACGFCQRMLPQLQAWEGAPGKNELRWVLMVAGSHTEASEIHLRSTIALDGDGIAARAFGANGTPIGVLLDREGHIASSLAVGADEIFALAAANVNGERGPDAEKAFLSRSLLNEA